MVEYAVTVDNADVISRVLRDRTLWAGPTRRRLIEGAGKAGHKTAQRAAKPHGADRGTLGRAIVIDFLEGGEVARVMPHRSIAGLANVIESGRRPGRRPKYGAIKAWMESHAIITRGGRGNSKLIQLMRDRIAASGTEGVRFMHAGAEVAERVLNEGVPATEDEIRAMWERRT